MRPADTENERYWGAHPVRAFGVRAVVFAVPLVVSVASGLLVSKVLPTPGTTSHVIAWWVLVLLASTIGVFVADREARRLLPLATLLQLSMLFPDRAPSRLKIARRVAGSRAIAHELEHAAHHGVTGDRQQAAETILALVGALGDYDSRTRGHSERTQLYVTMLADELGLGDEDKGKLMWAALVHDIGKLKVPHEVLNKPGKPTEEDWHVLHSHPVQGAQLCEPLREWLGPWWHAIEEHHEKFDGSGYPRGLKGNQISYGARIVAVADSYEVMTAARAYKRPMSAAAARQELIDCAGTHFDPTVVRAFLNLSLGRSSRLAGPLAWIAQFALIKPGPMLSQVLGATAGASTAAVSVAALSLGPAVAADATDAPRSDQVSAEPAGPAVPDEPDATTPTVADQTDDGPDTNPGTQPPDNPADPTEPSEPTGQTDPTGPGTDPEDAPPVLTDDRASTDEDRAVTINPLINDLSGTGSLELVAAGGASHGSVSASGGRVHYAPDANFHGTDSFTYTAGDGDHTDSATVSVTIVSVNDLPQPVTDELRLPEDADVVFGPLDNDTDPDGDSLRVSTPRGASHGTVESIGNDRFVYQPAADFNGTDQLTYTVSDGHGGSAVGSVDIIVAAVNDAPSVPDTAYSARTARRLQVQAPNGVLANASDVDGDSLRVVSDSSVAVTIDPDGSLSYLPVVPGTLRVSFVVSDGTTTTTARVTITVTLLLAGQDPLKRMPGSTPGLV